MRIDYNFENREVLLAQITSDGKIVVEDVAIDLDESGQPTTCFVIVEDAPPAQDPTYEELLEAYNIATGGVT